MTRSTASATAARLSLVAFLAAALMVVFAAAASAQSAGSAEEQMTGLINAERRAAGMSPLSTNVQLTGVARTWTPTMVKADKLSHNPNLAGQVGGAWTRLGENVGVARPGTGESAAAITDRLHKAFMASPGHKANILGDFDQVGLGAVWSNGTLWITVNFMKGGETRPNGPTAESLAVSRTVFDAAGGSGHKAQYAVLSRSEVFADALGGAGLAANRGPILFTNGPTDVDPDPALHSSALAELDRVLGGRGVVYLLGGVNAVSARVERELAAAGYTPKRLGGPGRVETSIVVADEIVRVHGAPKQVLLARADDWPDAVTGGAYAAATGTPLVLSGRDSLHPAAAAFLAKHGGAKPIALGGTAALSDATVKAAKAHRIAGPDRAATAVAVAEQLWGRTSGSAGDQFAMTPGYASNAWSYALAMAPWSATFSGPQLLVGDQVPAVVSDYLNRLGYSSTVTGSFFAANTVTAPVQDELRKLVSG